MAVLLYHKLKKDFSGKYFYSSDVSAPGLKGKTAYVVQKKNERSPPHLVLSGRFRVTSIENNPGSDIDTQGLKYRINLEQLHRGLHRIDNAHWFDWDVFRGGVSNANIYGIGSVVPEYVPRFETLYNQVGSKTGSLHSGSHVDTTAFDIKEIAGRDNLSDTEKMILIKARLGQEKFRKNVINKWGGHELCALTGCSVKEVLIASHIVPWRACTGEQERDRLDGCNGLLLCANVDKLFDQYKISFERKMNTAVLRYSRDLNESDLLNLGIQDSDRELVPNAMSPDDRDRFFIFLKEHYCEFCTRENI